MRRTHSARPPENGDGIFSAVNGSDSYIITRRRFLQKSTIGGAALAAAGFLPKQLFAAPQPGVSIVIAADDATALSGPAQWAIGVLQQALESKGSVVHRVSGVAEASSGDRIVLVGAGKYAAAGLPSKSESIALATGISSGSQVLFVSGNEARGLVYAVLELADRILLMSSVSEALAVAAPIIEEPHNVIRSICRSFQSEVEDKSWFNDKAFWTEYLSMLAAERVNRFSLSFGLGYDCSNATLPVNDAYTLWMFPFFVNVGGVSVANLPASERDANLAMLKYISDETAKRGIDFQLAIWTQTFSYQNTKYPAQGMNTTLGSSAHANYTRNALKIILDTCPHITGLTFRVHIECGLPLGNFTFWQTLWSLLTDYKNNGRIISIDMHAKNCLQGHIDAAIGAGVPFIVSAKKIGEHQGLPYHSAWIRPEERSKETDPAVFNGQASRYGYANFFKENRKFGILHRPWPGTQRHLLWGDPVYAAAFGRFGSFCGSVGFELNEPLSFKGRQGSGIAGGRCAYSDASLNPTYDFQKFLYWYRLTGRLLYNPDADPETWRRYLVKKFGAAARYLEDALGNASRICMLFTNGLGAAGSNYSYWPEMYTNVNIIDGQPTQTDCKNPLRNAEPFDPQIFAKIDDFAEALLGGTAGTLDKVTPIEFAQHLEDFATAAQTNLAAATAAIADAGDPEYRRFEIDVSIQLGLGQFFGRTWRAAVLWSIYRKTNDANAKTAAVNLYTSARQAWQTLAAKASVYKSNVSYGYQGGHWSDRTARITSDLNAMTAASFTTVTSITTHPGAAPAAIAAAQGRPARVAPGASHTPLSIFIPGTALPISISVDMAATAVRLHYRHVNQADKWMVANMTKSGSTFVASIPGSYTQTLYPLQYYFGISKSGDGVMFPVFDANLSNQPYYVVRSVPDVANRENRRKAPESQRLAVADFTVRRTGRNLVVRYSVNRAAAVSVTMLNAAGRTVASFRDNPSQGPKEIRWDMEREGISSGKYVVQIKAGAIRMSKVVTILK